MTLFEEIKKEMCDACGKSCYYDCVKLELINHKITKFADKLQKRAGNDENSIRYQTLQEVIKEVI